MKSLQLKELEESLKLLKREFNEQLNSISTDTIALNTAIIRLSSKYPEHADLLEFILFVNDRIDTKHTIFSEVVIDSFNTLVDIKKELLREVQKPTAADSIIDFIKDKIKNVGEIKITFIVIGIVIIGVIYFIDPQMAMTLLDKLWSLK